MLFRRVFVEKLTYKDQDRVCGGELRHSPVRATRLWVTLSEVT
jgi:hypothetical protein